MSYIYYWSWPYVDETSRIDVLVEETDRTPDEPTPDVITVTFLADPNSAKTTFNTDGLLRAVISGP